MFPGNIEGYEELEQIGKGGFATVVKARCKTNNLEVAIKKIKREEMVSQDLQNRVRQERRIHRQLDHPSIVKCLQDFEDQEYIYLVLELCREGDLQKYIDQHGPLSENFAAAIYKQIVEGFKYLHDNCIIYRDLSLKNLLLTSKYQVKIGDFGMAKKLHSPSETAMTMCGTPNFVSPEVASNSSHDLGTDRWGLGIVLYTLLIGKAPFGAGDVKNTLDNIKHGDYKYPEKPKISQNAKNLIDSLLIKGSSNKRMSLEGILRHPFFGDSNSSARKFMTKSSVSGLDSGLGRTLSSCNGPPIRCKSEDLYSKHSLLSVSKSVQSDPLPRENYQNYQHYQSQQNFHYPRKTYEEQKRNGEKKPPSKRTEKPPALNTTRLQPTRHRAKNAILSILGNGDVCVELVHSSKTRNAEYVSSVCKISGDGMRVILYKAAMMPEIGSGVAPIQAGRSPNFYPYEKLPPEHFSKYTYAARFVKLLKSKTPKITLYTNMAKCFFMENGPEPDFEVHFYDQVELTQVDGIIKIRDKTDEFRFEQNSQSCLEERQQYYKHYKDCYDRCFIIESSMNSLEKKFKESHFPATIGRKPTTDAMDFPCFRGKENIVSTSEMSSFHPTISIASTRTSRSRISEPTGIRNVSIPEVGDCTLFSNGILRIVFEDSSILTMNNPRKEIVFHDAYGNVKTYSNDRIPENVKKKLKLVKVFQDRMIPIQNHTRAHVNLR